MCPFLSFQVIVQSDDIDRVHVLHVGTSKYPKTPAFVEVPTNGMYLVTVLPIQDGRRILSGIAASQTHIVQATATHGIYTGPGEKVHFNNF